MFPGIANRRHTQRQWRRLQVERLERRRVMAASAMEIYALSLINEMRSDPPAFANELQQLRSGTVASAQGYSSGDPVWTDLREGISGGQFPSNYGRALSRMRASSPLPPLAWEDSLESKSSIHNRWMRDHCFAHSTPLGATASPCFFALPGLRYDPVGASRRPDEISAATLGPWSDGSFHENIGYQSGPTMPATRAVHPVGSDGHRQRQAYFDVINYVLEFDSPTLGHLESLLAEDRETIGLDFLLLDGFSPNSSATNYLSTQTLSGNRQSGAYLTGMAFEDADGDGGYDIGEGVSGCVTVTNVGSGSVDEHCATSAGFGRLSAFLPEGDYVLRGGLTSLNVTIDARTINQNVDVSELLNDRRSRVSLSESVSVVSEGSTWANLEVLRDGDLSQPLAVPVSLVGDSTVDITVPKWVNFSSGQERQVLRIRINDDGFHEDDESFTIRLGQPSGGVLGNNRDHRLTVSDNDPIRLQGFDPLFVESVIGQHEIPGDGLSRAMMFVADTSLNLVVTAVEGTPASDLVFIVDADLGKVSSGSGSESRAFLSAGRRYAMIFQGDSVPGRYAIAASARESVFPVEQNLVDPNDVNADGGVTVRDALAIINELARRDSGQVRSVATSFSDVNGDGIVAPRDALAVINHLATLAERASGEGESTSSESEVETPSGDFPLRRDGASGPSDVTRARRVDAWFEQGSSLF